MAAVNFFASFNYAWAQAAASYDWDDAQWKNGWATIGSTPPSVAQFDAVQKVSDYKFQYLFNGINSIALSGGLTLDAGNSSSLSSVLFRDPTTTRRGMPAAASAAEVIAGEDSVKMISPYTLVALTATDSRRGLAKIAATSAVIAGAEIDSIVTPYSLSARTALESRTGIVALANAAEAQAGTDDTKAMTPSKVMSLLRAAAAKATEALFGSLRIATQAETNAGVVDDAAITPKKMRAGFSISRSSGRGFVAFPTWMGGFIIQWANRQSFATGGNAVVSVPHPMAFTSDVYLTLVGPYNNSSAVEANYIVAYMRDAGSTLSATSVQAANAQATTTGFSIFWIGR